MKQLLTSISVTLIFATSALAQNALPAQLTSGFNLPNPTVTSHRIQKAVKAYLPLAIRAENQAIRKTKTRAKNLIVITTDGLRWQEVFEGARGQTREMLMPFFWNTFVKFSQIYGNRNYNSAVRVTNRTHISYPGYSEIICGFADDERIILNAKKPNPNKHVFEWINRQRGYRGRVAAFGSWDLFPDIFNEKRSRVEVNAGFEKIINKFGRPLSEKQTKLNKLLETCAKPWNDHVRPDTLTWAFAKNHLETHQPRAVFIGFGETDEYAHEGNLVGYLDAVSRFDSLLAQIWDFVETHEAYRGKTAIVITTDHGRGRKNWHAHSPLHPGSDETWLAVASPDIETHGEVTKKTELRADQFAQMMCRLIGLKYENSDRQPADAPLYIFEKTEKNEAHPTITEIEASIQVQREQP